MISRRLTAIAAAVTLFSLPVFAADLENADPAVQYRINIMRGISANASAIGLTLRNGLPQGQNLHLHAQAIALDARAAVSAFQPNVPDGVAKPEVWDNWKDFSDRLTALAKAADEVAAVAKDGGPDAAKDKLNAMFPMCKSCHDIYRKK